MGAEDGMWTEAHRARHEPGLKGLVAACAVEEIAAWLERADPPRSGRATPVRRVVGAIAWHLRVGAPWRPAGRRGGPCTAGSGVGSTSACSRPCCGRWRVAGGARAAGPSLRSVGIFGRVPDRRRIEGKGLFGASGALPAENVWAHD